MSRVKKFFRYIVLVVIVSSVVANNTWGVRAKPQESQRCHKEYASQYPQGWAYYYLSRMEAYSRKNKKFAQQRFATLPLPLPSVEHGQQQLGYVEASFVEEVRAASSLQCIVCGREYNFLSEMAEHLIEMARRISSTPLHCEVCNHECYQKGTLQVHMRKKHPKGEEVHEEGEDDEGGGQQQQEEEHNERDDEQQKLLDLFGVNLFGWNSELDGFQSCFGGSDYAINF